MLRVIKVETESGTIYFSEKLWVNLHLLWLRQNLMTALYRCIGSAGSARSIGFTGSIRSTRSDLVDPLSLEDPMYSVDPIFSVHLVDLKDPVGPIDLVVYSKVSASKSYKIYGINRIKGICKIYSIYRIYRIYRICRIYKIYKTYTRSVASTRFQLFSKVIEALASPVEGHQ